MMVLAHQGGWDEALIVAGPLLAIVGLLWLAKRRADRLPHNSIAPTDAPHTGSTQSDPKGLDPPPSTTGTDTDRNR